MTAEQRVRIGAPITTEQAARGVLRMIDSPMVGNIELDRDAGSTINRLHKVDADTGRTPYTCLSKGERTLVDIAESIWRPGQGALLSAIGSLDRTNRRKVLIALFYLHLGQDLDIYLDADTFSEFFFDRPAAS